jgi:hypothetical protein
MIAALIVERKKFFWINCRGASISDGFGCRVRRGSSGATFSFERGAAAITLDIHLEDGGVMDETIDRGERHGGVPEHRRMPQLLIGSCLTSRSPTRGIAFLVSDFWFLASVPGAVPVTSRSSCPADEGVRCGRRQRTL